MVDISVIIVNYNVRLFLEQTINSVIGSIGDFSFEIIVVDNDSKDNSVEYIKSQISYPINFIVNTENVGFAKANNQGIKVAQGKYILLLNPDTVVQQDTLANCLAFANSHNDIGAIGVRMVDGKGEYLPESKRAIPTPLNSFWKLTGVSRLFPRSSFFSSYNLGNIGHNEDAEVEVLCGAFMFMPSKVIREVGLLDEDYFMYGEDIDLSYKIKKAGYKIWYLGSSSIIHYKGQSTQKSSFAYVNTFYNAMSIFAEKHYNSSKLLMFIISFAIALRQLSSLLKRVTKYLFPIILDALIFFIGFIVIKNLWAEFKFDNVDYYHGTQITLNIIIYVLIWISSIWMLRSYHYYNDSKIFSAASFFGLLVILIGYGLLPESWRTSRAIILLGWIWILFAGNLWRWVYRKVIKKETTQKRIGIVGNSMEAERTRLIIYKALGDQIFTQQLEPTKLNHSYLDAQREFHQLNEIVFCLKDISLDKVLDLMSQKRLGLTYKLLGDKSLNIIGSNKSNLKGEVYGLDIEYQLSDELNLYYKRIVDIIFGFAFILLYPLLLISRKFRNNFSFSQLIKVLLGKMSLVGYGMDDNQTGTLPQIKRGCIEIRNIGIDTDLEAKNTSYALHYTPWRDIVILFDTIF